jgi:4-hydroxy-tetrahydrodipicolinate reductase
MNRFAQFDVKIDELHHKHKLDAPSGTALTLAGQIIDEMERKNKWVSGAKSSADELEVFSEREAEAPGTHKVSYISEMEKIEITHTAANRVVFAIGAIMAAEWLVEKKGIFGMSDLLFDSK